MQHETAVLRLARLVLEPVLAGVALSIALATVPTLAQTVRIPLPNNSPFPISQGVWVGKTLYLSGMLSPTISTPTPGDTQAQTVGAIQTIDAALKAQKLTL